MPRIELDLSQEENDIVEIYKAANRIRTKAETVKRLILKCKPRGMNKGAKL